MSMFRAYFYSLKTRKELKDHPANGKTWLATGGMVRDENGEFVPHTTDFIRVADYANLHKVKGEQTVTITDFPGEDAVAVKIWYGPGRLDGESHEWRKLVAAPAARIAA